MMKKRLLAGLLALVLLCLTACGSTDTEDWLVEELGLEDELPANTGIEECTDGIVRLGNTESEDPLRICIDLMNYSTSDSTSEDRALRDFLYQLKETVGLEDVVLEIIPSPYIFEGKLGELEERTAVRSAVVERIEAEILNGGGPDVFLATYMVYYGMTGPEYDKVDCLFKYPEKAMEYGYFLPLDEYMENNTVLTEWDKQTQPVLEAGRNWEGQQIIPLNYTLPLMCYPKAAWEHIPDKEYTWNDMLTHPKLLPYSLDLANCGYLVNYTDMTTSDSVKAKTEFFPSPDYLEYIMGEFVDFENEELCFTEEELLKCVNEILALEQKDVYEEFDDAREVNVGWQLSERTLNKPMTFLPLYNTDGGVTAHIEKYAAINRNTEKPEDAFKVIDLLMSKHVQRWSGLYQEYILVGDYIPLHEELFQESDPLMGINYYMTEENFEAFCKVREQITCANFNSEGTRRLSNMMSECCNAWVFERSVEEIVHEAYQEIESSLHE